MEPIYHEQIPAGLAKQLLQDDFIGGDNMSYYMIMEVSNTVILQHNNITGKDTEVSLPYTETPIETPIPKIESYRKEYGAKGLSKYVIIQLVAIGVLALITVAGFCIIYNIFR